MADPGRRSDRSSASCNGRLRRPRVSIPRWPSSGVADLATAAASCSGLPADTQTAVRRAALVHDVGRVAVPTGIWQKRGPLTADEWEKVRLHAYYTERVLAHSPFLNALGPIATFHHERLDGSGYHRGIGAASLTPPARLLAAADVYHATTEPRPHRQRSHQSKPLRV